MHILGETRPIINKKYSYILNSINFENNIVGIDNTRVANRNYFTIDRSSLTKDVTTWEISQGKKIISKNTTGNFNFLIGNQTYSLKAIVKSAIKAQTTIRTLGGNPKIELYWRDDYGQKVVNRTVGYLDRIYLIIKTSHIPVGDTLSVTIYEDEKADGHGDSSRNMGTYTSSKVNKNGYAFVYFTNLQVFKKVLDDQDYVNESEHEFYAKVTYDSHIATIYDKTQLKVKNEKIKLIDPPVTNIPTIVGEVDKDISDSRKVKNLIIGVFIDGTMNNRYDTMARTNWEKKRLAENTSTYNNGEHLKIYATKKTDVASGDNYMYGQTSYENDLSNPAILFDNYEKNDKTVFKIYTEGMGTNTLGDEKLNVSKYEKDDSLGAAVAWGSSGIVERVKRAVEQTVAKIKIDDGAKERIGTITIDVFGFSRGAASARHFIHEISKPAYKARPVTGSKPIPYSTRDQRIEMAVDDNGNPVDSKYRKKMMPTNGRFGYLLTEKGITIDRLVIRFAGLYDTVAHHGVIQGNDVDDLGLNTISGKAQHIVHMTADDEHRYNFSLSRIPRKKNHIELNIPGVHCDVGGSYVEGRPEGLPTGVRVQDLEESHVLAKDDTNDTVKISPKLEQFRTALINEGWFTDKQIHINSNFYSSGKETFRYSHELVSSRAYVSNQYSYIPLHMMLKFAKEKKLEFGNFTIKNYDFTPNIFPDHLALMQRIKANLETYADKVIASPSAQIKYQIPEADLKRLRNNYLHYNAVVGLVNKPEKGRIRDIIKPSK
ncbi:T6SS phospholipase effector Tle1-like catalytic domain-containing protein [Flavobacterium qiangtangense]|uniref:T6SS phospholipase effector Tle1-like catalytic domain-containing protein n=1 Tax=Flavobacterium qiangtangense TaxID=1442595 RepID=A0ABW1PJA6_9FLAO